MPHFAGKVKCVLIDPPYNTGKAFQHYDDNLHFMLLGEPIFDDAGNVNPTLDFAALAAHIWFYETQTPLSKRQTQKTFLGVHQGIGYALLYNGLIKDKSAQGGNALTCATLKIIRAAAPKNFSDKIVVYGNDVRLQPARLQDEKLEFRKITFALKQKRRLACPADNL